MHAAATRPTAVYDPSGPPEAFRDAAKNGDLDALRAAADWYRDRGQPADPDDPDDKPSDEELAFAVEALRGELEVKYTQAKHLRRLLDIHTRHPQVDPLRLSENSVVVVLRENAIPVEAVHRCPYRVSLVNGRYVPRKAGATRENSEEPRGYLVVVPTDHTNETESRERLCAFLALFFPRAVFVIDFNNSFGLSNPAERAHSMLRF